MVGRGGGERGDEDKQRGSGGDGDGLGDDGPVPVRHGLFEEAGKLLLPEEGQRPDGARPFRKARHQKRLIYIFFALFLVLYP